MPKQLKRPYSKVLNALEENSKNLYADVDASLARPRSIDETERNTYIPLAPSVTGTGGLVFQPDSRFFGDLRVRYLKSRPANEDYSLTARGYTLVEGLGMLLRRWS